VTIVEEEAVTVAALEGWSSRPAPRGGCLSGTCTWRMGVVCSERLAEEQMEAVMLADSQC